MKILVTGANGFLGTGIVRALLDKNHEVIALDLSSDHIDSRAEFLKINIFEDIDYDGLMKRKPDVVLHLAWRDGFIHGSEKHLSDLPKHYNFLKKISDWGVNKVAVLGTVHEIGFFEGSVNEHTPCNPSNLYGISKNALRNAIETISKSSNFKFQWLRGFYIVSNTSYGNSIFSKIYDSNLKGNLHFPFTTGENQFDFLDYDDFCDQVVASILQDEVLGIINICSGKPEKLSSRVERFIVENNMAIKLDYGKFPDRPYDSKAIWGDNSKIELITRD